MFERSHHRDIALVLQALEPQALSQRRCYFGGGTAMALRYGEYRESMDIDFIVSDVAGYRDLRQALRGSHELTPLLRTGMALELAREVRADQYGIRTRVKAGASSIKFEIVLEGRIELATPSDDDRILGIQTLAPVDLAAEKLLANADRWNDAAVYSRDVIDLAMMRADKALLESACLKAEEAYGDAVRRCLLQAVDALRTNPARLKECMAAMKIEGVSQAQLWQAIKRTGRALLA